MKHMNASTRIASPWDENQSANHSLTMLYAASVKTVLITGSQWSNYFMSVMKESPAHTDCLLWFKLRQQKQED